MSQFLVSSYVLVPCNVLWENLCDALHIDYLIVAYTLIVQRIEYSFCIDFIHTDCNTWQWSFPTWDQQALRRSLIRCLCLQKHKKASRYFWRFSCLWFAKWISRPRFDNPSDEYSNIYGRSCRRKLFQPQRQDARDSGKQDNLVLWNISNLQGRASRLQRRPVVILYSTFPMIWQCFEPYLYQNRAASWWSSELKYCQFVEKVE